MLKYENINTAQATPALACKSRVTWVKPLKYGVNKKGIRGNLSSNAFA